MSIPGPTHPDTSRINGEPPLHIKDEEILIGLLQSGHNIHNLLPIQGSEGDHVVMGMVATIIEIESLEETTDPSRIDSGGANSINHTCSYLGSQQSSHPSFIIMGARLNLGAHGDDVRKSKSLLNIDHIGGDGLSSSGSARGSSSSGSSSSRIGSSTTSTSLTGSSSLWRHKNILGWG